MPRRPPRSALLPYARPFRAPPAVACGVALVVTVGEAFVTTTASAASAQGVGPAGLFVWTPEERRGPREGPARCAANLSEEEAPLSGTVALPGKTEAASGHPPWPYRG